jgi:hypothetical protein
LKLHALAFEKLKADPEGGKAKARELLDRWLVMPHLQRQAPLLRRWREVLDLPVDELESTIMSEDGQQLRQCSPMGALITPQERFAVFRGLASPPPVTPK